MSVGKSTILASTLSVSSDARISGNLIIDGNLTVLGNTSHINIRSETVAVQDNMIFLNANLSTQAQDGNDIGWYGQTTIGSDVTYIGVGWDKSSSTIRTFKQTTQPGATLDSSPGDVNLRTGSLVTSSSLSIGTTSVIKTSLSIGTLAVY